MNGFLIAAPSSGSGKTLITLGLLRSLRDKGLLTTSAKAGPDYIDPAFHAAATGRESINLDPWAMRSALISELVARVSSENQTLIVEAMMGLFDGAADGSASAADLAMQLALPVVLVIDASRMSFSVAALVEGFRDHREGLNLAGVILNKVGSARHETMLRAALAETGVPVLGAVPTVRSLEMPSRHLGLVQAGEYRELETFMVEAAVHVAAHCDLDALQALTFETKPTSSVSKPRPLGQRISIAQDEAFSFLYPHLANGWREQGAEISFFSPLKDQAPAQDADAIFLPGGYPELHAGKLSKSTGFLDGIREAAKTGKTIYGECGGYMVLGGSIVDEKGHSHAMAGLLDLETSFEKRKLHLGYRRLKSDNFVLGDDLKGHEFHYTTAVREEGTPLFHAADATGLELGRCGLRSGNVMGSYMHVIDQVAP